MRADADAGRGKLTLGSLFDGSGGFPLGALLAGIQPKWASEIEPFPVRVTTKRLPSVKHLGDIHNIRGDEIESVDIITFGSPCTDLSIAGKRAGLEGRQSCLFFEAVRIIKEMRCVTNGKSPRFIVWENVTGAFSSSAGRDFQAVLTEIVRIKEPQAPEVPLPEKGACVRRPSSGRRMEPCVPRLGRTGLGSSTAQAQNLPCRRSWRRVRRTNTI